MVHQRTYIVTLLGVPDNSLPGLSLVHVSGTDNGNHDLIFFRAGDFQLQSHPLDLIYLCFIFFLFGFGANLTMLKLLLALRLGIIPEDAWGTIWDVRV